MLSIIVPAFNEENVIKIFYATTSKILTALKNVIKEYEIIFVDDGSIDNTWRHIQDITKQETNVHGIKFSRNFGKEAAIFAGLHKAKGNCAIIMDCDLQHPPEYIEEMYLKDSKARPARIKSIVNLYKEKVNRLAAR